ncbi:MAG: LysR family transcriptional regulator [Proteobacteria bacterium]|nr:LysR family transcriptional regulator [Pseudomonadota bacterium]
MAEHTSLLPHMLGRLRLRHLHLVDALIRSGNLHRAASELRITQPAATKALQDIEEVLGVELFTRSSRGMAPTAIGTLVGEAATRMMSETQRLATDISMLAAGGYGQVALGTINAATPDLIPRALAILKARYPRLTVNVLTGTSDQLLQLLEQRNLDVVLGRLTQTRHRALFSIEPIGNEDLWAFGARETIEALGPNPDIETMVRLPWVLQPRTSPLRGMLDRIFAQAGYARLDNVIETASIFTTLQLVRTGGMIACLPMTIIAQGLAEGELATLPLDIPNLMESYGLILRKDEAVPQGAARVIAALHAARGEAAQNG